MAAAEVKARRWLRAKLVISRESLQELGTHELIDAGVDDGLRARMDESTVRPIPADITLFCEFKDSEADDAATVSRGANVRLRVVVRRTTARTNPDNLAKLGV
mmetsp:Transcript_3073/g.4450  ORF Transcript_3073/g.4450 Transcript_3073/m.4450 type:complete len:103 (-) Transcript_3073:265-573(-)